MSLDALTLCNACDVETMHDGCAAGYCADCCPVHGETLSDPIPASRVPYGDDGVYVAEHFPGPVLHGYADVRYHERYLRDHGLGPGRYRRYLPADAGPCNVAMCSHDGRYHYCGEYGDLDRPV